MNARPRRRSNLRSRSCPSSRNLLRNAFGLACVIALLGCASVTKKHFKQKRFETQEEAGSGHVAVLSTVPWDDETKAYLQPEFPITPEAALKDVLPTAMVLEQKLLDVMKVVASVSPPGTSLASTSTSTAITKATSASAEESGKDTVTAATTEKSAETAVERTEQLSPGSAPAVDTTAPSRTSTDLPGRKDLLERDLGIDPQLKHALATAYFQEVQLLNHYVKEAVERLDYTPYVVRVQATLMPMARNEPYDAYTSISFFPTISGTPAVFPSLDTSPSRRPLDELPGLLRASPEALTQNARVDSGYSRRRAALLALLPQDGTLTLTTDAERATIRSLCDLLLSDVATPEFAAALDCASRTGPSAPPPSALSVANLMNALAAMRRLATPSRTPIVVPLLVTDSLEATLASRSTNVVRQYAVALSALINGFSLSVGAQKYTDELLSTVGNDYNSLYTVSRLTENTIRVRMGAMLQSAAQYAMVPQTRNITLLLLVPNDITPDGMVSLVARTEFVDAVSGEPLPQRPPRLVSKLLEKVFSESLALNCVADPAQRMALALHVSTNRFDLFTRTFSEACIRGVEGSAAKSCSETKDCAPEQAWTTLTSMSVGSQFTSSSFSLPKLRFPSLPPVSNVPIAALDDEKSSLTAILHGGRHLAEGQLTATLTLDADTEQSKTVIPASRIVTVDSGRIVQSIFPSLSRLKLAPDRDASGRTGMLSLLHRGLAAQDYKIRIVSVAEEPEPRHPAVSLSSLPVLRAANATASFELFAKLKAKPKNEATISLKLEFLKDGKPASGSLSKDGSKIVDGGSFGFFMINECEIKIPSGKDVVRMVLALDQLSDGSTLRLTAKPVGATDDLPAGTREIQILVPPPPPKDGRT